MKTNLFVRFLTIIAVAVISCLIAWRFPPQLGIDLAGGTSLLYELDMSKAPTEGSADLAARVVEVLKSRVDPKGVKNIIWRVVEGRRIQIQMPYPSGEVRAARAAREKAEKELRELMWKQAEIEAVATKASKAATPEERRAVIDGFLAERVVAPAEAAVNEAKEAARKSLAALAEASLKLDAAKAKLQGIKPEDWSAEDLVARNAAQADYGTALRGALSQNVDFGLLTNLMKAASSPENKEAQAELAALPEKYPLQRERVVALVAASRAELKLSGGGVDSPEELERLVTKAGVLDFRIAVQPSEVVADRADAEESLRQRGPELPVRAAGTQARWFEIDPNGRDNLARGGYVTATWAGNPYILCYDDHDRTLTHSDPKRKPWSVSAGNPYNDPSSGGLILPFQLDGVGANYMGDLTGNNKQRPMAILLDDKAMSAPTIQSQISDHGQITFGTPSASHPMTEIVKEAQQLKQIMDAGSLPATLQSEPISKEDISPDMGADNIQSGVRSGMFAVLAVVVFMLAYYSITGAFANLALMLNLVLVLATMAMIRGTFTLPGIAGLVLTLGMAVDANVLINERIREEIHRGASLWMAVKQGYDKVFWTIFDSNLTTALTSVVLIFVGTEEVKGFGVTLLIGLAIQFFTALFVTRTLMIAAVKWGLIRRIDDHSVAEYFREIVTFTWLRGRWPFMRVITVSNVDWIAMRYKFWAFSGIITLAGVVAFFWRGEDKYDIEFRGGTQVTFQLKDSLADVSQTLHALAAEPEILRAHGKLKDLADLSKMTSEARAQAIAALAGELAADKALVERHPEVETLPAAVAKARAQKTPTIDEVRGMVEALKSRPGLTELEGVRVYGVGAPAAQRYQMQTTIANAPHNYETLLPAPLKAALGASIQDAPVITHDSSASRVTFVQAPVEGRYLTEEELRVKIAGLAGQPGLKDLAQAQVQGKGKPEEHRFEVTVPNQNVRVTLLEPLAEQFKDLLETRPRLSIANGGIEDLREAQDKGVVQPILAPTLDEVFARAGYGELPSRDLGEFSGGAAIMLDDIQPRVTADRLMARLATMRRSAEFSGVPNRDYRVIPVTVIGADGKEARAVENDTRPMTRAALVTVDTNHLYEENDIAVSQWRTKVAGTEWKILGKALAMQDLFEGVTSFDAVVAAQAKVRALVAIAVSLVLIVIYVWVRFGGIRYGIGAILSLGHDAAMAVAGTVLAGVIYNHLFGRHNYLLITDFKINLTMIAAYLTVIGYSVNDTIVIFDRVRELRGKSQTPLTAKLINDAINQCFGRTIWTSFTVFVVLMIMYIWGGDGVRGFCYAMLIGVFTGVYSTLAIASPMLLATGAGKEAPRGPNPFMRKDAARVPELPEETGESA